MNIKFTKKQQDKLMTWYKKIAHAHHQEECIDPGFSIVISYWPPVGADAEAHCGSSVLDLGDVELIFEEG